MTRHKPCNPVADPSRGKMRTPARGRFLGSVMVTLLAALGCHDALSPVPGDTARPATVTLAQAPSSTGVVERFASTNDFVLHDPESGLTAVLGFDRVGWCAAGGSGGDLLDFLAPVQNIAVSHADGRTTLVSEQKDELLVVYQGIPAPHSLGATPFVISCDPLTVIGEGRGTFHGTRNMPLRDSNPPSVVASSLRGQVSVNGQVAQVHAQGLVWIGFRAGELIAVREAKVRLSP